MPKFPLTLAGADTRWNELTAKVHSRCGDEMANRVINTALILLEVGNAQMTRLGLTATEREEVHALLAGSNKILAEVNHRNTELAHT